MPEANTQHGRFTVCVLCFGDHAALARTCLSSLLATLPAERMDLRIGLNAVCEETRRFVAGLPAVVYDAATTSWKYPRMAEMFHDPAHPITTPYTVWLDDDTRVLGPQAWQTLATAIIAGHPGGRRLYGWPMTHDAGRCGVPRNDPLRWFRQGPWWRNRQLPVRGTLAPAPNGAVIPFVPGWAWAVHSPLIAQIGIPDRRLEHNGGDITIGAMVHQAGWGIGCWNRNKEVVWTPPNSRRGFSQSFPWTKAVPGPGTS